MSELRAITDNDLERQRWIASQATRETAALRGELGTDAQLIAMAEMARQLRAAGDEDGYQAIRAAAWSLFLSQCED